MRPQLDLCGLRRQRGRENERDRAVFILHNEATAGFMRTAKTKRKGERERSGGVYIAPRIHSWIYADCEDKEEGRTREIGRCLYCTTNPLLSRHHIDFDQTLPQTPSVLFILLFYSFVLWRGRR